ncbi:sigma-54-dependent Fis family transcriptional regulator [candidate division KSB1 bacterium]|nr:sigma-54-dependent Fis family transcriptional regulator [candidate division KSB1 bacterium]
MKIGAYDFITKPITLDSINVVMDRYVKYQQLLDETNYWRSESNRDYDFRNIIGESASMQQVFETIKMIAASKATVLIKGESGTGKELIARAIHYNSDRSHQPFIKNNCAALPEGLIESELFGHEKGAFTGALRNTKGRFELADLGTLLLDEISEMNPTLQAKLLRVLQEEEFEKIGSSETVSIDVRIIATTNRDLKEKIKENLFREDLYYRLNVVPIFIPPLRERKEDITFLVGHFIEKYNKANKKNIKNLTPQAIEVLMAHDWPGNVRELENTIQRAVVISKDPVLDIEHLTLTESRHTSAEEITVVHKNKKLEDIERETILSVLKAHNGNRKTTAEILGINERTLRNKLNQYREKGYYKD